MAVTLNPASILSGQGFDIATVVQQALSAKSGQLTLWQNQQTDISTQAGILQGINNNLTSLASSLNGLVDPKGALAALTATSSQPGTLTATVQTSATPGSHQITVTKLASQSLSYSDPVVDGVLAAGSFQLQVGSGTSVNVPVTANETLDQLASYINTHNLGVIASVINDANGQRLSLLSNTAGQPGTLNITANSVAGLNFNTTAGSNAALTVDGVPIDSSSNTVTGVISGVTLNLGNTLSATPVQLTVSQDTSQITTAVNSFVTAYNAVVTNLNTQFTVDPTTNTEGPLGSDGSLRLLQSSLLADVTSTVSGNGGFVNLATLGINLNNDGTLTVNNTATNNEPAFSNVLATNPNAIQNFFQNASATGFANNFGADLNNLTDPTEGVITTDIAQNTAQKTALANSITDFQDQLAAQTKQLTNVFAQVNATLQAYPLLLQQVTETLASLPGTSGSNSTGFTQPTLTSGL